MDGSVQKPFSYSAYLVCLNCGPGGAHLSLEEAHLSLEEVQDFHLI